MSMKTSCNCSCGKVRPLSPTFEFKLAKTQMVDHVEKVKSTVLKSWVLRWQRVTWPKAPMKLLWQIINEKRGYKFCPYAYTPRGVGPLVFYVQSSRRFPLEPKSSIPVGLQFLLAVITPTLLPSKLEWGGRPTVDKACLSNFAMTKCAAWVAGESCINIWDV